MFNMIRPLIKFLVKGIFFERVITMNSAALVLNCLIFFENKEHDDKIYVSCAFGFSEEDYIEIYRSVWSQFSYNRQWILKSRDLS